MKFGLKIAALAVAAIAAAPAQAALNFTGIITNAQVVNLGADGGAGGGDGTNDMYSLQIEWSQTWDTIAPSDIVAQPNNQMFTPTGGLQFEQLLPNTPFPNTTFDTLPGFANDTKFTIHREYVPANGPPTVLIDPQDSATSLSTDSAGWIAPFFPASSGPTDFAQLVLDQSAVAAGGDVAVDIEFFGAGQSLGTITGTFFAGGGNGDIPEPSTLAVLGLGLVGCAFLRRRRKAA